MPGEFVKATGYSPFAIYMDEGDPTTNYAPDGEAPDPAGDLQKAGQLEHLVGPAKSGDGRELFAKIFSDAPASDLAADELLKVRSDSRALDELAKLRGFPGIPPATRGNIDAARERIRAGRAQRLQTFADAMRDEGIDEDTINEVLDACGDMLEQSLLTA